MRSRTPVMAAAMCLSASLVAPVTPSAAATPAARADSAEVAAEVTARVAAPPTDVFALIVTNNRSTNLDRPDLQYADDDGARYHQLFTGVAAPERVRLLTRFDRATALTHAPLMASVQPPRPGGSGGSPGLVAM